MTRKAAYACRKPVPRRISAGAGGGWSFSVATISRTQPPERSDAGIARALFDGALPGEVENLDPAAQSAIADFVAAAAAQRSPGTAAIVLDTAPGEAAAPGRRRLGLAIVGDDMPFIVDSVSAAITAEGLAIDRILHPVVDVRRDADGALVEIIGVATGPAAAGVMRESMLYIELERTGAKARAALVERLRGVLADVRAAVEDWPAMLSALRQAARGLVDRPPPVAPHVNAEAVAFLDWLAADNFTLLGVRQYDLSGDLDDPAMQQRPGSCGNRCCTSSSSAPVPRHALPLSSG